MTSQQIREFVAKGYWRELAANMTETPGYHEQVDDLSSLHKLLKAIKKLGYHAHSAKQKAGGWLVWATEK
jgi:predicted ArsR family transcriptional regulator